MGIENIIGNNGAKKLAITMPKSKSADALDIWYLPKLTPEIADLIQNNQMKNIQRKYKRDRERHHKRNIVEEKFRSCSISVVVYPDGSYSIVDGQHRLGALATATYDSLAIMFDIYYVKDTAAAAAIFSTFDHPDSSRNLNDSVAAYGLADMYGVKPAAITTYHNTVLLAKNQTELKSIDNLDKKDIDVLRQNIANNIPFIELIEKFKKVVNKKKLIGKLMEKPLFNAKGLVALFHLYNEKPELLEDFFMKLEALTNMDESGTPLYRIYRFMEDYPAFNHALWTRATPTVLRSYIWLIWEGIFHNGANGKQNGTNLSLDLLVALGDEDFKFHGTSLSIRVK